MDSEEALIEEEIRKELDKLTEADLESSDNSLLDTNNTDNSLSEDGAEVIGLVTNMKVPSDLF